MKVTKGDIIFQMILLGLFVGVLPAITISIDYSKYKWLFAVVNATLFIILSFLVHRYQVKKGGKNDTN